MNFLNNLNSKTAPRCPSSASKVYACAQIWQLYVLYTAQIHTRIFECNGFSSMQLLDQGPEFNATSFGNCYDSRPAFMDGGHVYYTFLIKWRCSRKFRRHRKNAMTAYRSARYKTVGSSPGGYDIVRKEIKRPTCLPKGGLQCGHDKNTDSRRTSEA